LGGFEKKSTPSMKSLIFILLAIGLFSCDQETKSIVQNKPITESKIYSTIIVKHEIDLTDFFEVGFYSKSYYYLWLNGKDTLDFMINASEYKSDNTLHLIIQHKNPMPLSNVLKNIDDCFPIIKEDFVVAKLSSIEFKSPIYYVNIGKQLSIKYEQKFGQKVVDSNTLNQFLLKSSVTNQINDFLNSKNKKVLGYQIENFQLMEKNYYIDNFPKIDFSQYPDFVIDGVGMNILLEAKQNNDSTFNMNPIKTK
jgi:hypothetical protein